MPSGPWFLRRLEVQGHVGVGAAPLNLEFMPCPGIVVVSARNGVGKTSAADGLRHVLSGGLSRQYQLEENNLHCETRRIVAVVTNGSTDVEIGCSDQKSIYWRISDGEDQPLPSEWVTAYGKYNPILLYPEVSSAIEAPSTFHKFLDGGLSMDVLRKLIGEVDVARKIGRDAGKRVSDVREEVLRHLHQTDGATDIADRVERLDLFPTPEALAEIEVAVAGLHPRAPSLPELPLLWSTDQHTLNSLQEALGRLREAQLSVLPGAKAVQEALADLANPGSRYLERAREDDICPACGSIGKSWVQHAQRNADQLAAALTGVREAERQVKPLLEKFRSTFPPVLPEAAYIAISTHHAGSYGKELREWAALVNYRASIDISSLNGEQVAHLGKRSYDLARWYEGVREGLLLKFERSVGDRLTVREFLNRLIEVVETERPAHERGQQAERLGKQVERWIRDTRAALFDPIAEQVKLIWGALSSDGDLGITDVTMSGGVRQSGKINIGLSIGSLSVQPGPEAPRVLSTGQRNALSLATYMPRALQPESPFKFLVLDDPVHAFDVWRVRFLAKLLTRVAASHQVVIFTHDERLWYELRAQGQPMEHIRLNRRPSDSDGSATVFSTDLSSPGSLYLDELEQILQSDQGVGIGTDSASSALALTLCRQALDVEVGISIEVLGRRAGMSPEEIEEVRSRASETRDKIGVLNDFARAAGSERLVTTQSYEGLISALNHASHGRAPDNISLSQRRRWVKDTRRLIRSVRATVG